MIDLALEVVRERRVLVARFPRRQRFLSWAIVRGGATHGHEVAWCQVGDAELTLEVDAGSLLKERLALVGAPDAVGLLTSSDVGRHAHHAATLAGLEARCIVTVGLGNRLRAGDPPGAGRPAGTINVLCALSRPLTDRAMIEATALCAEARAIAVLESGALSLRSGLAASGTGTDCQVIAAPDRGDSDSDGVDIGVGVRVADALTFVGKHTDAGHLIGHVVLTAVTAGVRAWMNDNARD